MHGPPAGPAGAGQRHWPTQCEQAQPLHTAVLRVTMTVTLSVALSVTLSVTLSV